VEMTAPTHHRRRDIKELIRRARDYELRARLAKDASEQRACVWFAKMQLIDRKLPIRPALRLLR